MGYEAHVPLVGPLWSRRHTLQSHWAGQPKRTGLGCELCDTLLSSVDVASGTGLHLRRNDCMTKVGHMYAQGWTNVRPWLDNCMTKVGQMYARGWTDV